MTLDLDFQPVAGEDSALQEALAAAGLPVDDLSGPGRSFFRFSHGGEVVGFGGLEAYAECALLRSVVVLADFRGRGFGQMITRKLLGNAHDGGAGAAYLLTETAAPFFAGMGFHSIARIEAPPAVLATRQAANLCPASAALMVRTLPA